MHFSHLPQSQLFPQLHSLLSFIGQFLAAFLQFGLSAAKDTVQIAAIRIENRDSHVLGFARETDCGWQKIRYIVSRQCCANDFVT